MSDASRADRDASHGRVSDLLNEFLARDHGPRIALGDVMTLLGDRAFGALLLILSIPNVLPVPGLSTATGLPMILIGAQMAAGRSGPWLPRRMAAVTLDRDAFLAVMRRAEPWAGRIERHLRERLPQLVGATAERLLGVAVMILAGILALPIVFGNQPPAFAIALIALGLIERDGAFVLAGLIAGLLAIAIIAAVLLGLGQAGTMLWQQLFG
ncbi:exopolysaccharide biosynthesis protein [Azospirillum agricola]|uniref:exopolysaccharide biosynthesis protein n=1 Tax=Azospirillum agricola TaxID=1720247 RepID=UPI000A0F1CBB|nr:exopolysaccharide biosynthesis protein [Azospirillum agricola]SMH47498.1 Uncharacterized conserved protein [Azospirillum lipoferum]